jgi:hypothetical protein
MRLRLRNTGWGNDDTDWIDSPKKSPASMRKTSKGSANLNSSSRPTLGTGGGGAGFSSSMELMSSLLCVVFPMEVSVVPFPEQKLCATVVNVQHSEDHYRADYVHQEQL